MVFDPSNALKCIRFFINGQETSTPVTKAVLLALSFLDIEQLGPCLAMFAGAGGTGAYAYIDKWRCCQLAG